MRGISSWQRIKTDYSDCEDYSFWQRIKTDYSDCEEFSFWQRIKTGYSDCKDFSFWQRIKKDYSDCKDYSSWQWITRIKICEYLCNLWEMKTPTNQDGYPWSERTYGYWIRQFDRLSGNRIISWQSVFVSRALLTSNLNRC